jgi:hypothetical protein
MRSSISTSHCLKMLRCVPSPPAPPPSSR